jgi:hypothetical protein
MSSQNPKKNFSMTVEDLNLIIMILKIADDQMLNWGFTPAQCKVIRKYAEDLKELVKKNKK